METVGVEYSLVVCDIWGMCAGTIHKLFGTISSAIAVEFPEGASRPTLGNPCKYAWRTFDF